jgi:hypothetical protein
MSKSSRARKKDSRARDRRGKKQAAKAQYESWRDTGVTKGSRRARHHQATASRTVTRNRGPSGRQPFPWHVWCDASGVLRHGSPHKAFLAMRAALGSAMPLRAPRGA